MPKQAYMSWIPNIHFEISERKILLRIFDLVFIFLMIALVYNGFDFEYLKFKPNSWKWVFILIVYYTLFAAIFEMYDLQKAANSVFYSGAT